MEGGGKRFLGRGPPKTLLEFPFFEDLKLQKMSGEPRDLTSIRGQGFIPASVSQSVLELCINAPHLVPKRGENKAIEFFTNELPGEHSQIVEFSNVSPRVFLFGVQPVIGVVTSHWVGVRDNCAGGRVVLFPDLLLFRLNEMWKHVVIFMNIFHPQTGRIHSHEVVPGFLAVLPHEVVSRSVNVEHCPTNFLWECVGFMGEYFGFLSTECINNHVENGKFMTYYLLAFEILRNLFVGGGMVEKAASVDEVELYPATTQICHRSFVRQSSPEGIQILASSRIDHSSHFHSWYFSSVFAEFYIDITPDFARCYCSYEGCEPSGS